MSKIDKSLTVGVEIEMTGLSRAHAADIVATELGGHVKNTRYKLGIF